MLSDLQQKIITSLYADPSHSVTELSNRIGAQRPSVSRSLHSLKRRGLVTSKPQWALTDSGISESKQIPMLLNQDSVKRTFSRIEFNCVCGKPIALTSQFDKSQCSCGRKFKLLINVEVYND